MIPMIEILPTASLPAGAASSSLASFKQRDDDQVSLADELFSDEHKPVAKFHFASCGELDEVPKLTEKSVIIHKDENGFGLRVKGQAPVFIEHVHENGAAWRAGARRLDIISKVNGTPVASLDHKEVVLMFKNCTRFVSLSLLSSPVAMDSQTASDWPLVVNQSHYYGRRSDDAVSLIGTIPFASSDSCSLTSRSMRSIGGRPEWQPSGGADEQRTQLSASQNLRQETGASSRRNLLVEPANQENSRSCGLLQLAAKGSAACPSGQTRSASSLRPSCSPAACSSQQMASNGFSDHQTQLATTRIVASGDQLAVRQHQHQQRQSDEQPNGDKRRVCVTCRASLSDESEPMSGTCAQCQLRSRELAASSSSSSSNKRTKQQPTPDSTSSQLQRIYRGFRDSGRLDGAKQPAAKQAQTSADSPETSRASRAATIPRLSQSPSTGSLPAEAARMAPQTGAKTSKRLEIVREFIDTERAHTDRLRCLDELFYRPLKSGGLITGEQLRQVFSCHRTLFKVHRQIYRILQSANFTLDSELMVGSALLEIFEGDLRRRLERAACVFCSAQSTNAELLNKLTRRDTKVGEFLAHVTSQRMVGRLGIKDLLASCFQRLTKYPLLLESLLKATPRPQPSEAPPDNLDEFSSSSSGDRLSPEEALEKARASSRMLAITLEEEREFIERALAQSRRILVKVNESIKVAVSHHKLKEIWKRTDKYPGVPLIDISKQQVLHEGLLTLRLSKRSFDVYVLLLNDYIIILTREGQDKYRLKFFTPDGKSSSAQAVYSPVFVIDEHLTTRDAATDENGFYLLCKRKDDSRIYEFASRSPNERKNWRDKIQWTIERQMSKGDRRPSCESTITKSSSEISTRTRDIDDIPEIDSPVPPEITEPAGGLSTRPAEAEDRNQDQQKEAKGEPTKIEGTISLVEDDGIVMPSKIESSRALVDQAVQVSIFSS